MIAERKEPFADTDDLAAALQYVLERQEAMSLKEVCDYVAADRMTVGRQLKQWIGVGQVVELCPARCEQDSVPMSFVFYRWRRASDRDFAWERHFFEGNRRKRLFVESLDVT